MKDNHAPPDNLASRVIESYCLDEKMFRQIIDKLDEELKKVAATSEAPERIGFVPWLDGGVISVRGEYHVGGEGNIIYWDSVGRLVGGSRIGKHGLYLQTFKPPKECSATPHPNLLDVLREYII